MSSKLTLMATVAIFGLIVVSAAPISLKKFWKESKGLNGTERAIVQRCLYYGAYGNRGPSTLKLANFPSAFCALLYRPESEDPRDASARSSLSPREQVMREFFYLEAAQLWSFYLDFDHCLLLHGSQQSTKYCTTRGHIRYEGIFYPDFKANKYGLWERAAGAAVHYRPAMRRLEHCFHLHQQHPAPQFYQRWQLYEPCARQYAAMGWSLDHLPEDVSTLEIQDAWKSRSARRHFELRTDVNSSDETAAAADGGHEEMVLWDREEEELYQGLYNRSVNIFGHRQKAGNGKQPQWSSKIYYLYALWHSDRGIELSPQLRRLRDHLKSNRVADRAYDCLKFHRWEEVPWCNNVTYTVSEGGESFTADYMTANHQYSAAYLRRVEAFVESERLHEHVVVSHVSSQYLAFLALPEKIADHCSRQRHLGDEDTSEDCLEGGLFGNFFL